MSWWGTRGGLAAGGSWCELRGPKAKLGTWSWAGGNAQDIGHLRLPVTFSINTIFNSKDIFKCIHCETGKARGGGRQEQEGQLGTLWGHQVHLQEEKPVPSLSCNNPLQWHRQHSSPTHGGVG